MKVGFIGLGIMGTHMARHVREAGYETTVHDVRKEAAESHLALGCTWADTPREVGEASDVVFTSLPGPQEVQAVAFGDDGLMSGMRNGSAWFDLTTNSPTVVRELHALFAEKGIAVLDSPVSGGPLGAESKNLSLWVGGDKAEYDRHKSVLDAIGDKAKYLGDIGTGSIAKLVHNAAGYAVQAALAEVFTLGVKAGMPALDLWEAAREGANGRIRTFDTLARHFLPDEYDPPSFALKLARKDVRLAADLGREFDVPLKIVNLVHEEMTEALNRGWGHRDSRSFTILQKERAAVEIRVPRDQLDEVLKRG